VGKFFTRATVLVIIGRKGAIMPLHSLSKRPQIKTKENIIILNAVGHT
jgi:hypothetical protein